MTDHASMLDLEKLVCGEGTEAAQAHVKDCPRCLEALTALQTDQTLVGGAPYERAFQGAVAALREIPHVASQPMRGAPRPVSHRLWAVGFIAAVAATFALLFVRPPPAPEDRLKGNPTLIVLDEHEEPAGEVRPNDRLSMVVTGSTLPFVAVLALEASGQVTPVWPTYGRAEARPPSGRLPIEFEVTEGSVEILVLLGPEPFAIAPALAWVSGARRDAPGRPPSDEALRSVLPYGLSWARSALVVRGER
jgi:hypothetical protein